MDKHPDEHGGLVFFITLDSQIKVVLVSKIALN
jgi:hypothetical protein